MATHQPATPCDNTGGGFSRQIINIPTWDHYLEKDASKDCAIENFKFPGDLWKVVITAIEILVRIAVYLSVGLVMYAGFKFMIAQGNPEKIQEAKSIIEQSLTGLAISILATTIVTFIARTVV
jgi:hypothetical protein